MNSKITSVYASLFALCFSMTPVWGANEIDKALEEEFRKEFKEIEDNFNDRETFSSLPYLIWKKKIKGKDYILKKKKERPGSDVRLMGYRQLVDSVDTYNKVKDFIKKEKLTDNIGIPEICVKVRYKEENNGRPDDDSNAGVVQSYIDYPDILQRFSSEAARNIYYNELKSQGKNEDYEKDSEDLKVLYYKHYFAKDGDKEISENLRHLSRLPKELGIRDLGIHNIKYDKDTQKLYLFDFEDTSSTLNTLPERYYFGKIPLLGHYIKWMLYKRARELSTREFYQKTIQVSPDNCEHRQKLKKDLAPNYGLYDTMTTLSIVGILWTGLFLGIKSMSQWLSSLWVKPKKRKKAHTIKGSKINTSKTLVYEKFYFFRPKCDDTWELDTPLIQEGSKASITEPKLVQVKVNSGMRRACSAYTKIWFKLPKGITLAQLDTMETSKGFMVNITLFLYLIVNLIVYTSTYILSVAYQEYLWYFSIFFEILVPCLFFNYYIGGTPSPHGFVWLFKINIGLVQPLFYAPKLKFFVSPFLNERDEVIHP